MHTFFENLLEKMDEKQSQKLLERAENGFKIICGISTFLLVVEASKEDMAQGLKLAALAVTSVSAFVAHQAVHSLNDNSTQQKM